MDDVKAWMAAHLADYALTNWQREVVEQFFADPARRMWPEWPLAGLAEWRRLQRDLHEAFAGRGFADDTVIVDETHIWKAATPPPPQPEPGAAPAAG